MGSDNGDRRDSQDFRNNLKIKLDVQHIEYEKDYKKISTSFMIAFCLKKVLLTLLKHGDISSQMSKENNRKS